MILIHNSDPYCGLQGLSGTFAGLMDLYERNYIGMRRLVPQMPPTQTLLQSRIEGGLTLHLRVVESFPYTSEVALTYHFLRNDGVIAEPDLHVRVYSDAQLAEVTAAHLRHWPEFTTKDAHRFGDGSQLLTRWRVNRFLFKWLNYCLHQGHCFGDTSRC